VEKRSRDEEIFEEAYIGEMIQREERERRFKEGRKGSGGKKGSRGLCKWKND
jgi:hypothetical protein